MKHDEIATKKIIELAALANDGDAATEYVRLALGVRTRDVAGRPPRRQRLGSRDPRRSGSP